MINLFIDAEWYINQRIFLIGYAYEDTRTGKITTHQLFSENIYPRHIRKMLAPTTGYIFVYGPDIGMLEKVFRLDIRGYYRCVNFLKVVKYCYPSWSSYRLCDVEKKLGFKRKAMKYKADIFSIYKDWRNPELRKLVLQYNREDVYYLARIKQRIFNSFIISPAYLKKILLK